MVAEPAATAVARPVWSIVVTPVLLEFHDTGFVKVTGLPEALYPVAENCVNWPTVTGAGLAGDTTTCATFVLAVPGCVTLTIIVPEM